MQCNNNLKQIALAALNVESQSRAFPGGGWGYRWMGDPEGGFGGKQPGSWCYQLLPALEQSAMFQLPSDGEVPEKPSSTQVSKSTDIQAVPLPMFICPSRRTAKLYPTKGYTYGSIRNSNIPNPGAKTDYAGNWGTYNDNKGREHSYIGEATSTIAGYRKNNNWPDFASKFTGIFYAFSQVTVGEVRDGLSNTYIFGEKYLSPDCYETLNGNTVDDYTLFYGVEVDSLRTTYCGSYNGDTFSDASASNMNLPMQDRAGIVDPPRFGSCHAGSLGMAMCDGSVQRVSYSISGEIHTCKGDKADMKQGSAASFN